MKSRVTFKFTPVVLCGLCAAGVAGSALAQTVTPAQALISDKFVFNLGAFVLQTDLKGSLNGQSAQNPEVDFDESFGRGNDATRIRADALWRITPAHHLRFMYFNNSNDRTKTLTEVIKWGDYAFQPGTTASLKHDIEVYELAYEWAFMRSPNYEVAASFGVHYTDTTVELSGTAIITKPDGTTETKPGATKTTNVPAPLPVIGLRGAWAVAPQWVLDAQVQYFGLGSGEFDGSWSDLRASATWMFSRNFGVGLGYNRFYTKVDVDTDKFNGRLKTGYSGLQAFLTGSF